MPSALVTKRQKVTHRSRHCHSKSKPLSLRSHSAKLSMLTPSPVHHGTIRSSLSLVTLLRPPTPFLLKVRGIPPFEVYHLVRAICPSVSSCQPHLSTVFLSFPTHSTFAPRQIIFYRSIHHSRRPSLHFISSSTAATSAVSQVIYGLPYFLWTGFTISNVLPV